METFVVYFKVEYWNLYGEPGEKHEKFSHNNRLHNLTLRNLT